MKRSTSTSVTSRGDGAAQPAGGETEWGVTDKTLDQAETPKPSLTAPSRCHRGTRIMLDVSIQVLRFIIHESKSHPGRSVYHMGAMSFKYCLVPQRQHVIMRRTSVFSHGAFSGRQGC
tara:strand:+ start:1726 stop:2079 length:354 start_codon:yes stop_codon:yes gene_type:complete